MSDPNRKAEKAARTEADWDDLISALEQSRAENLGLIAQLQQVNLNQDAAWIAGIIDGEGSIFPAGTGRSYVSVQLRICMTDERVINRLHQTLGGTVHERTRQIPWKKQYEVVWSGEDVRKVIKYVGQYLFLKRPQAGLALRILDLPRGHVDKMKYALQLRALNKRGRDTVENDEKHKGGV